MRVIMIPFWALWSTVVAQQWQPIQDFPGTARDDAAAFSIGTTVYMGTGHQTGWVLASDWYSYDIVGPGSGWQTVAPLPSTPRQYCTGIDGGYLFGGLDASGPLNELWKYSPGTNSWSPLAPLPAPGRYAACGFNLSGRVFVANGMLSNGIPTNEFWEYVPSTDSWTQHSAVPGPARHRSSCFIDIYQLHGYVIGGADSAFNALRDVWRFELNSNSWSVADSLPEPRYGADASWVFFGDFTEGPALIGGASNDSVFHANGFIYDPSLDSWSDLGQILPHGIRGAAMASAGGAGGWNATLYGTGLDPTLFRRNEIYETGYVFGVEENDSFQLILSPNPGFDHFSLTGGGNEQDTELTITDATGRLVQQRSWQPDDPIVNTRSWPSGIYYISLQDDRSRSTAKWIKLLDPQ